MKSSIGGTLKYILLQKWFLFLLYFDDCFLIWKLRCFCSKWLTNVSPFDFFSPLYLLSYPIYKKFGTWGCSFSHKNIFNKNSMYVQMCQCSFHLKDIQTWKLIYHEFISRKNNFVLISKTKQLDLGGSEGGSMVL